MTVEQLMQSVNGTRFTKQQTRILAAIASGFNDPGLHEANSITDCEEWLLDHEKPFDFFGLQIYQNIRNLIRSEYLKVAGSNVQPYLSITNLGLAYLHNHDVISKAIFDRCLEDGTSNSFELVPLETREHILELQKIDSKLLKLERTVNVRQYLYLTERRNSLRTEVDHET
tara:strand:+ start:697 stop:1209 length:513 start_codon:yes stop_codon:yes gene_type:complete